MSIGSLTAFAVARNSREPTKADAGEVTAESEHEAEQATIPQLLVKQVPIGLVAAYTALTAATVELIDEPAPGKPHPDQLLSYRWAGLIALVVLSLVLTHVSYRAKAAAGARRPVAEMIGVGTAAAGWGLVIPDSPLLATLDGDRGTAMVLLIGFVAVGLNLIVATRLQKSATKTPAPPG